MNPLEQGLNIEPAFPQSFPARGTAAAPSQVAATAGDGIPTLLCRQGGGGYLGHQRHDLHQVGRQDLFPVDAAPALNCRVYRTPGGRVSPLPDAADLAARLREALARPWDLPGWVDPRKEIS